MTKARNIADLLDANGDVKTASLDNVPASNNASALTTGTLPDARLSNQAKVVKSSSAPSNPQEGDLWYDTSNEILKNYVSSTSAFDKISPSIPTITSISGDIVKETASNLTISGTNFLPSTATVKFTRGSTTTNVTVTPSSTTSITVAVPSATYTGASVGNTVSITVTNTDNRTTPAETKSVIGRPVTLSSISGNILNGSSSTLTLTGVGFSITPLIVKFAGANNTTATVASNTSATVVVPSAIYNQSSGTTFSITVTNADSITSSGINKTSITLPTGGTITNSGGYRIHSFTSSGTFTNTLSLTNVEYLVIAGAGGGGGRHCGGGGAGGYRSSVVGENSGRGASAETRQSISAGSYSVTVGAGGAGASGSDAVVGQRGSNSVFNGITSLGGGGGANDGDTSSFMSGGSGGGGTYDKTGGSGTSGQGYDGGGTSSTSYGSGGGGASANGSTADVNGGGNGGDGVSSSITGSAVTRAGGGGGANHGSGNQGQGGSGGGANAGTSNQHGTANTGGGGGGHPTGINGDGSSGGTGGSGIVIVRYQI